MSKLRDWRKARKMTQETLAKRLGTTGATVSRIEAGEQWPSPAFLTAIERTTKGGVKTADILSDYQSAQRAHAQAAE
jgi:transcriptional regulator with XRE-family HTH domain